ncbi:MAG: regulatory iron-sulfur-containing complex subunit RicT [Phycisphaerales bacterium]|jgi:cell fate regulator YaaT (PSP1 superfamily)|nr:regulatory iron-sulfur-containing complex subunit RicT [Phycisphaerales bacterium]
MSIFPLEVFEEDADPARRDAMTLEEQLAATDPPKTFVVRFGRMKQIGEYESRDGIRAGCGSKFVVRTHRGIELATMLTTTCSNGGCPTSVSRSEIRSYIEASGGKDYPFYDRGKVLRVATPDDLRAFTEREGDANALAAKARELAGFYNLEMKIVDAEMTLESERGVVYYQSESRVDFRELAQDLGAEFRCRIDMRQVGSRDEARLVADYERCGQHCCCKNFLKVLKPVSMRSAKQQKATLDPLKISGRCGRLMCCLRYEDQTYKELKAKLPHRKTRVGTMFGPGIVQDGQILTQLVRVRLEDDGRDVAVPVEELLDPDACPAPGEHSTMDFGDPSEERIPPSEKKKKKKSRRRRGRNEDRAESPKDGKDGGGKKRRRRRRKGGKPASEPAAQAAEGGGTKKKRRRRRRRKGGGSSGEAGSA